MAIVGRVEHSEDSTREKLGEKPCVKYLTCWYWSHGGCRKTEAECLYSHWDTGMPAAQPRPVIPGGPPVAGRNALMALRERDCNWRHDSRRPSACQASSDRPVVQQSGRMCHDLRARSVSPFVLPPSSKQSGNDNRPSSLPRLAAYNRANKNYKTMPSDENHRTGYVGVCDATEHASVSPLINKLSMENVIIPPPPVATVQPPCSMSKHHRRLTVGVGRPGLQGTEFGTGGQADSLVRSAATLHKGLDTTLDSLCIVLQRISSGSTFESASMNDVRILQVMLGKIYDEGLRTRRNAELELGGMESFDHMFG